MLHVPRERIFALRDREGRALGERAVLDEPAGGAEMVLKRCPYTGSRHHHEHPMNASALTQMTQRWSDVLGLVGYFHSLHSAALGHAPARFFEVWHVIQHMKLLPWFLTRRAQAPVESGALDPLAAVTFKLMRGIDDVVQRMSLNELLYEMAGELESAPPLTGASIHDEAEQSGALIGPNEVCAGPPKLIEDFAGALIVGPAVPADVVSRVRGWLPDSQVFARYVHASIDFTVLRFCFVVVRRLLVEDLLAAGPDAPETKRALEEAAPASDWTEPFSALDDDERADMLQALSAMLSPSGAAARRTLDDMAAAFREHAKRAVPDRAALHERLEVLVGEGALRCEDAVRAALGREALARDPKDPVALAHELFGDALARYFSRVSREVPDV